jgi:hypothetical protein
LFLCVAEAPFLKGVFAVKKVQPSIKKEGFSFFDGKRLVLKQSGGIS